MYSNQRKLMRFSSVQRLVSKSKSPLLSILLYRPITLLSGRHVHTVNTETLQEEYTNKCSTFKRKIQISKYISGYISDRM